MDNKTTNQILEKLNVLNNEISDLNESISKLIKQDDDAARCNFCASSFVYIRAKSNSLVCRRCGRVSVLSKEDKENGK